MSNRNKALPAEHAGVHEAANRKRDNIIRSARSHRKGQSSESDLLGYDEALTVFEQYLSDHAKKKTPERLFILKKLYECQGPVDIQTLFKMVCEEEGLVSLTTVYNNLSLLIDAQLVHRLDLVGGKMSFFEKTIGAEPHGFIICDKCGSIRLLNEPELFNLQTKLPRGFRMNDVLFHIHGVCHKCQQEDRKAGKRIEKTKSNIKTKQHNNKIQK